MDAFMSFLDQDTDQLLPVLCGYFLAIFKRLLASRQDRTLEYLLVHRKAAIFDQIMRHQCQQDSLMQVLTELISVEIRSETE